MHGTKEAFKRFFNRNRWLLFSLYPAPSPSVCTLLGHGMNLHSFRNLFAMECKSRTVQIGNAFVCTFQWTASTASSFYFQPFTTNQHYRRHVQVKKSTIHSRNNEGTIPKITKDCTFTQWALSIYAHSNYYQPEAIWTSSCIIGHADDG